LDNVYNYVETALFWKLEPSKTLARRPLSGTKKQRTKLQYRLPVTRQAHQNLNQYYPQVENTSMLAEHQA
jgi:hypothetical protein